MAITGIPISENECIGDSLGTINNAFANLDSRVNAAQTAADSAAVAGVTKIIAGTNISISPAGGTGDITITGTTPPYALPARLGPVAQTITNWNDALENGWYMADNALNAPTNGGSGDWYLGNVEAHNGGWVTQTIHQFNSSNAVFKRDRNNGNWSTWIQIVDLTGAEYQTLQAVAASFDPANPGQLKLAQGGGLEYNEQGELKLSPVSESSTYLVVRPSDGASTDDGNVPRTNNSLGELAPYFKTVAGAMTYAKSNISSNYNVLLDEDTDELSFGPNWSALNGEGRFFTQAEVNASFPNHPILKAGFYAFSNNGVGISGLIHQGGTSYATNSRTHKCFISSRYWRPEWNAWTTWRKIDEHPKQVRTHAYFCTNTNRRLSDGLGNNAAEWTTSSVYANTTSSTFQYLRMSSVTDSSLTFQNVNFVMRSNIPDIALWDAYATDFTFHNCTWTMLGSGNWYYGAITLNNDSTCRLIGSSLRNPSNTDWIEGGYAAAIIGNTQATESGTGWFGKQTSATRLFWLRSGSKIDAFNYSPFVTNAKPVSILLDGKFCNMYSFIDISTGCSWQGHTAFLASTTTEVSSTHIVSGWFGDTAPTLGNRSVIPVRFDKASSFIFGTPLRLPAGTVNRANENAELHVTVPYDYYSPDYLWTNSAGKSVVNGTDQSRSSTTDAPNLKYIDTEDLPTIESAYASQGGIAYGTNAR